MKISYSRRETKNLGNYESMSVEISMEEHINSEELSAEEGFNKIRDFVLSKFIEEFSRPIPSRETVKDRTLDHETVKKRVLGFCINNKKNKELIENLLQGYKVSKIKDLNQTQLTEFNNKLNHLIYEEK